jgi:hypothetical protein
MKLIGTNSRLQINPSGLLLDLKSFAFSAAVSSSLRRIAHLSFGVLIITIPVRYRLVLQERPYPPIYREYTDILLYASDIFMLLTIISWLICILIEKRTIALGPSFLTFPIFGLLLCSLLSVIFSVDPFLSAYNAIRLILLTTLYLYIVNETRSFSSFVIPIFVMICIQSVIGIVQVLNQSSLGLTGLGEHELNPEWSGVSIVSTGGIRWLRAYGLTDHPNILGGCLAWSMIILLTWATSKTLRWTALATGTFTIASIALLLTYSRSAWLAFIVALLLYFMMLMRNRLHKNAVRSMNIVLGSLIVLIPFIWTDLDLLGVRFNFQNSFASIPQENQSIGERILLNQAGNKIFTTDPVTGVGLSAFPLALSMVNPDFPVDYQPAHFVLLDVAVETGIFGALFFAILVLGPWVVLWINRRNISFTPPLIGASCLLAAVTILGFLDYYPWLLAPGRLIQWISWGLWGVSYQHSRR